ncbi:hypothetical protein ACH5RR_028620 [Cinchona calisaya]|uniref:BHLH domain-containing protein n=1 Tax=Cinchona calisaya TaxID=153742 RepID=A0ABD2YPB4_9GENT
MEFLDAFNGISENYGFQGIVKNGSGSSSSLVLDNEKGELVRALVRPGQKGVSAEKALIALRNHSEAERRRRERINGHLTTLRSLIPGTNKMDKAALLAEVVNHVKELRKKAAEATKGMLVPTDMDEVRVEQQTDGTSEDSYTIRAFLCCDYKQELLSDLRQALETLPLKTVRAEIATLGSRMVNVFEMTGYDQGNAEDSEGRQLLANSVRQALSSVLDKFYASEEFLSRNVLSSKRRRVSLFTSASSSSVENFW